MVRSVFPINSQVRPARRYLEERCRARSCRASGRGAHHPQAPSWWRLHLPDRPAILPQWPKRKVSQAKDRQIVVASDQRSHRSTGSVPAQGTKENPDKKNQGWTRKRARFTKPGLSYGELSDETAKWRLRLRSWHKSVLATAVGPEADRARLHGTSNAAANRNMTDKLLSLDDLGARSAPLGRSCLFGLRPCCLPSRTAYRWLGVIHRTSTEPI